MQFSHPKDKAAAFSQDAFEKLMGLGIAPLPEFYELWYTHFSGENPELSHAIELLELHKKPITAEVCQELYNKYLNNEESAEQVKQAGTQIQSTIMDVNAMVTDVKDVTEQYNTTLTTVTDRLSDGDCSEDEVKEMLDTIVGDTATILEKNQKLEQELSKQAEVMVTLQRDLERVRQEAMTDGLTNVANRKAFDQELTNLIDKTRGEEDLTFSLVLMDIDHFKEFNDTYGHQVGDQVLRLVARTLLDGVKGRDFVARYGGEEFVILLPGTNQHAAEAVANDLREAVANKEVINRNSGKKMGRITLSGGVTEFYDADEREDMIERADTALYQAKNKGRNMICASKVSLVRDK